MAKKQSKLQIAIDSLRKEFDEDEDIIKSLTEYKVKSSEMVFIPTGSLDLDRALVRGGIPTGRIVEVYGPPAGGKSTVAMEVAKSAQKLMPDKKVVYVDAEMALDPDLPINMGLDPEKFILIQGYTGEENLDILERLIKSDEVSISVVDSVDALIPKAEERKEMTDVANVANLPQIMSRACRRFAALCRKTNTSVIFINQIRHKIMTFGNPETTSGGNALPFYASVRLRVSGSGETKKDRIIDEFGNIIGHHTHFEVKKNKLGPPYRRADVDLIYGKGFDYTEEIIRLSIELAMVDKSKNGIYTFEDGSKIKSVVKYIEKLDTDNEFRQEMLDKIGNMINYKSVNIPDEVEEELEEEK